MHATTRAFGVWELAPAFEASFGSESGAEPPHSKSSGPCAICGMGDERAIRRMFAKPLLTEFWRDVVALGSAIITVVSWLIAIWQIRKTKSAAVAAREAADRAVREGRRGYDRFLVGTAVRYVEGLKDSVDREDWGSTVIRLGDFAALAEQLSQNDPSWKGVAGFLWDFEKLARRKARGIKKPFPTARWEDFLRQIQATIYPDIRPFSEPGSENGP